MQNKYAADIGDFGKFILLRQLHDLLTGTIGVNWYCVDRDEIDSNDGRHVAYLDPQRPRSHLFSRCDEQLYATFQKLVEMDRRSIADLERCSLLGRSAIYFGEPVPYRAASAPERIRERRDWFHRSKSVLKNTDILLLDPDNGIQTRGVTAADRNAVKYALADEIKEYCEADRILIVYNHRDRAPYATYARRFTSLHASIGNGYHRKVLHAGAFSARDYLFLFTNRQMRTVERLFKRLTADPLKLLFREFLLPPESSQP